MILFLFCTCLAFNITLNTSDPPIKQPIPDQTFTISLLMATGDDAEVFQDTLCLARKTFSSRQFKVTMIALEPGPLVLSNGMRLLPQEVRPRFSVPDLLIVCASDDAIFDRPMLSFVRACLDQNTVVIIVAKQFPQAVLDMPLEPSQRLERCDPQGFSECLEESMERMVHASQDK